MAAASADNPKWKMEKSSVILNADSIPQTCKMLHFEVEYAY